MHRVNRIDIHRHCFFEDMIDGVGMRSRQSSLLEERHVWFGRAIESLRPRKGPQFVVSSTSKTAIRNAIVGRTRRKITGLPKHHAPSIINYFLMSVFLVECARGSTVGTIQLETNDVLISVVSHGDSLVASPPPIEDSSVEDLSLLADSAAVEVVEENHPVQMTTSQLPPDPASATEAAEARRPNATSRDEGSRRHRPADIRCYCNLPRCVTTGYMCKSPSGVCFSDLADRTDVELATHGCIELFPRRSSCRTSSKKVTSNSPNCSPNCTSRSAAPQENKGIEDPTSDALFNQKKHDVVMLLCCHSDMCNHIDSPEIRLRLTNDSLFAGSTSVAIQPGSVLDGGELAGNPALYFGNRQDGWFRVATIAVPICGAFILMLLIFVAFKILRHDSEDHKLRGQRHKQWHSGGTRAWDEEDFCLRHAPHGHLLSPDGLRPEESCQRGCTKMPSPSRTSITNPISPKIRLLPQRVQAPNSIKKCTKLDYFFLFPQAGKFRKQGKLQHLPMSEEALKTEAPTSVVRLPMSEEALKTGAPTAVVIVPMQGGRGQI